MKDPTRLLPGLGPADTFWETTPPPHPVEIHNVLSISILYIHCILWLCISYQQSQAFWMAIRSCKMLPTKISAWWLSKNNVKFLFNKATPPFQNFHLTLALPHGKYFQNTQNHMTLRKWDTLITNFLYYNYIK